MKDWNALYEEAGVLQTIPSSRVIAAIKIFKESGAQRVLDLGCGTGRHTTLLLDEGFEVYGCDSAREALNTASQLISEVEFTQCSMCQLPYDDSFFDAIVCNHVIQHGLLKDAQKAAQEMTRVLRSGGRLCLIVVSTEHPKAKTGREIEPNTRIDTDALDGHVPHHFFTEDELRNLFKGFDIEHLEHFTGPSELDPDKGMAAWNMVARKV